jgi:tetratricopeptide (TPR) repeat protein
MRDDDKRTAHDLGGGSAKIIPLRPSPAGSAGQLAGHLRRLALEASANLVELVATADQYGVEVPAHVRRAAAALEGASPGADAMAGQQAMNRRQVLGGAAAVAGALVLGQRTAALQGLRRAAGDEATQRVVSALKRPGKVDAITVADMEAATAAYRRGYRQLSVRTLLPQAEGQVQVVEELLGGSMKPTLRKRLTATAAEAHALVGVMLLMDLYTFDAAWWQLSEALSAAREAQAGELEAFVLGAMAFNAGYAGRRAEAIDLITEARTIARAADGPRTRGWLAAVESELRARTGDARASLAALADAESALQGLDQHDGQPWIGVGAFDAAKLKGYYGLCYLQLQQPQQAVGELTAAVNALNPTLRKHRCTALADLATALIQLGEVEEGCRRASQALKLAMELRHAVSVDRIRELDRHLAPWQDTPAVKMFREQLLEQLLIAFQASPSLDW